MGNIPQISARKTIKALEKIGFVIVHQRGSHIKLARIKDDGYKQTIIIPNQKVIKKGTLKNGILDTIPLSIEDFLKLLKK